MKLTIDHTAGDAGRVVLVGDDGKTYAPGDTLPDGERAFVWVTKNVAGDDPLRDRFLRDFLEGLLSSVIELPARAEERDEQDEDAAVK